jgi:hypothetical protein
LSPCLPPLSPFPSFALFGLTSPPRTSRRPP